jgi:AraC-like DNA-binding protein
MELWNLTDILTIVTAFQLLLLAAVILTSARPGRLNQRILATFLLSNVLLLVQFEIFNQLKTVSIGVSPFYFLLSPLLYLYVQSLFIQSFKLRRKHLFHLVLFFLVLTYFLILLILRLGRSGQPDEYSGILRMESTISSILLNLQIAGYLASIFMIFIQYRRQVHNHFSEDRHSSLNWLLFILMAFALMWLTDFTSTLLDWFKLGTPAVFHVMTLVSVSINFVFATVLVYRSMEQSWDQTGIIESTKYGGSNLSDSESAGYAQKIRSIMEKEKLYLDPEISLRELSEKTGISPRYLSQVINSRFNQNFFDFINHYRIEEAKRLMAGTVRKELTILEVMYHVGFNSKSSFQSAFRKNTGTTPTEFRHRSFN